MWDGRVFTSPGQLKAYLTSRGLVVLALVARHPTAFGATAPAVRSRDDEEEAEADEDGSEAEAEADHHREAGNASRRCAGDGEHDEVEAAHVDGADGPAPGRRPRRSAERALPARYAPAAVQRFYDHPDRRMVALAAADSDPPRLRRLVLLDVGLAAPDAGDDADGGVDHRDRQQSDEQEHQHHLLLSA